jgi:hypothetical protein
MSNECGTAKKRATFLLMEKIYPHPYADFTD